MFKKMKFMLTLLSIKMFNRKPFPIYVNLVINSRCNLDCKYCFGNYHNRMDREYTFEEITDIVDRLYKMGTRYILLQGGEPFIRKDFAQIISYIHKKGIIVAIVTNGTFVEKIKELKELKLLDNICFSLDGMAEGNDKQRGEGVFDKVMQSVDVVKQYYPKLKIRTNAVITKNTIDTFKEYLDFCWNKGIEVQVSLMFKDSPLAADPEKVREINQYIYNAKKNGAKIVASSEVLKYVMDWPYDTIWVSKEKSDEVLKEKAKQCQYGNYEYIVDNDGAIYPCNAMQGTFTPKNLRDTDLKECFDNCQSKPCYTCNIASMIDTSEIINWNFKVIFERVGLELKSIFKPSTNKG